MSEPQSPAGPTAAKPKASWINLAVDYGPLIVFFLAYRWFSPKDSGSEGIGAVVAITKSTFAFMLATVIALIISKWRLGRISPMLWLSSVLIIGFGALTIYFGDPIWIEHKPTAVYLIFSVALLIGYARGKAVLKYLLEAAFDGLSHEGWLKISRNWGFFFAFLALFNELVLIYLNIKYPGTTARSQPNPVLDGWVQAKLFLFTPLSFLFTFTQIPMLLKHGLGADQETEVEQNPPHD